ncbi:hypothetical protein BC332_11073 [Capsicum chinense]|nr:hypothetical protein BC332_11073 [Capsicum chinense]
MVVAVQPAKEAMEKKKPLMKNRRVIVNGFGVVSPIGHDPHTVVSSKDELLEDEHVQMVAIFYTCRYFTLNRKRKENIFDLFMLLSIQSAFDFLLEQDRDEFMIGEGSGVLLLEELEQAKLRFVVVYKSIPNDLFYVLYKIESGVVLYMEKALADSGVKREDVNYKNAHAASTPAGDLNEYQTILF